MMLRQSCDAENKRRNKKKQKHIFVPYLWDCMGIVHEKYQQINMDVFQS